MIEAAGLTRRFDGRTAVDNVSFTVARGEIFGLLGPNGAGKTTTLRLLAGLITPSAGTATVAGIPLAGSRLAEVRARVGFLTEAPGLWDRLTVRMNLLVYARLYGLKDPATAVTRALALFGLEDRANSPAAQLSKGMKQKIALARALMHDPAVVLLDEPTSGLDPQTARMVRDLILTLRDRGHAVVISTHNLDEAERVSTRIGVLQRSLIALDTPDGLRQHLFGHRVRFRVRGDVPRLAEAAAHLGAREPRVLDDGFTVALDDPDDQTPAIVRALVERGAHVLAVVPERAPLEDVYLTLIGEGSDAGGRP
jgi:ABC-2 type transport system ATP-binding protein